MFAGRWCGVSHTFLFATIFCNDSLVCGRSILSGISASAFKKPVQMVSIFGPDLVQIWSRFHSPDHLDQFWQPPSGVVGYQSKTTICGPKNVSYDAQLRPIIVTTSRVTAENFSAGVLPDEFLSTFTNFC